MAMVSLTYRDATVIVIGEEVGRYGGAYGVTRDLMKAYGPERVINTPISEAAIVGAAVGAAMTGLRPVAELMYVDFLGMSMDQLANQAAKIRYMFGGQAGVPMVLRTQGGTGRSAGAQHSQSLEAWVMPTPGLRLAMPATVADAHHLLRQSLTKPDPVVFIEHKALYTRKEDVDLDAEPLARGKAGRPHRSLAPGCGSAAARVDTPSFAFRPCGPLGSATASPRYHPWRLSTASQRR